MISPKSVTMLLTNAYSHDPRVRRESEALQEAGFSVHVLAWDRNGIHPANEQLNQVDVKRFGLKSTAGQGFRQLGGLLRFWIWCIWHGVRHQVQIIHCNDLDTLLPGLVIGWLKGERVIFDAHEHFPSLMKSSSGPKAIKLANSFEKILVPRADLVITVGQRLAKFLIEEGARRVEIIYNSRDKEDFVFEPKLLENWRSALGMTDKKLVVTYLGTLFSGRYLDVLMEAVSKRPDVGLVLAGEGTMKPIVREYAKQYHNIVYVGLIPEKLVLLLTSMGDAIFSGFNSNMPNTYFSTPNKLFHALAAKKPLIVTRGVGEIGEIVEQYQLGPMLEPVNQETLSAAFTLLMDSSRYDHYFKNLEKTFSERYSWQSSKDRLILLYQSLLAETNS